MLGRGLALVCLAMVGAFAHFARAQDPAEPSGGEPELRPARLDILVLDVARVRSTASAYVSIQQETERGRDVINDIYQQRLAALQARSNTLLEQEAGLISEEVQAQIAELESQSIELETRRRSNLALLERRRLEASNVADIQLNSVLATLLREAQASYILNQQSALVWPDASNVTDRAIDLMNERVPSVSFEINISEDDVESGSF